MMSVLKSARRLLVSAKRATKHGDATSALELTLIAAKFLRLASEIDRMDEARGREVTDADLVDAWSFDASRTIGDEPADAGTKVGIGATVPPRSPWC